MQHLQQPRPLARGVNAAAPYVTRPPSPPYIHVPSISQSGLSSLSLMPSFDRVDPSQLTLHDLAIITQNKMQLATDSAANWRYESRRQAQRVLDFLYLGPYSVLRDRAFLQREGITMLLGIRDSRLAQANLMLKAAANTAQALGIEERFVDVASNQELVRAAPVAVQMINDHMLAVYRSQAIAAPDAAGGNGDGGGGPNTTTNGGDPNTTTNGGDQPHPEKILVNGDTFRRGRVLVFCETGNDRSAAIVAAYIMAVFGVDLVRTLQFVGLQRFCTNFDDETKYWLKSFEDILKARRSVQRVVRDDATAHARLEQQQQHDGQQRQRAVGDAHGAAPAALPAAASPVQRGRGKRGIEDTMDEDDEREAWNDTPSSTAHATGGPDLDMDRYVNRHFVPFVQNGRGQGMALDTADIDAMSD